MRFFVTIQEKYLKNITWKRLFKIKHMSFLLTPALMKYPLQRLVFPLKFNSNVILQFLLIVNSSETELEAVWQRFSVFFLLFFKKRKCYECCPKFKIFKSQKQSMELFCKKAVLKTCEKFIAKQVP